MTYLDYILSSDPQAQTKRFKKGDLLQRQGELHSKSFFVRSGLLRSYIIDEKGKEHIFHFASENWIIADLESQEFDQPTELFIDCIEDAEVVVFSRECIAQSERTVEMVSDDVSLLSRHLGVLQRRVLMLMSTSASERYAHFLKAYPQLPDRVPQRMIASYLGITPQALSTLRSKRAPSD